MAKKYPEVVIGAFIRDNDGRILLVKSYKWPDKWVVGGGHVEFGEKIEDAAKREIKEEYGVDVEYKRIIDVIEIIKSGDFINNDKHFVGFQCECLLRDPDSIKLDNDELQEYRWFTLREACKLTNIVDVTLNTLKQLYSEEKNAQ